MIFNPNTVTREPYQHNATGEYFDGETSIPIIKEIVKQVKEDVVKAGYKLNCVVAVNRRNGKKRVWDMSKNAATYATALTTDWRFASKEEAANWVAEEQAIRVEAARKKLRFEQAAVETLSKQTHFQNLVDTALTEEDELREFSAEDIAKLEERLAKAKASLPPKPIVAPKKKE